jgi:single-strand DNA-binding protein
MVTRKTVSESNGSDFNNNVSVPSDLGSPNPDSAPRQEVTKIGNLVKDPQLRYTVKGQALCEVDLAVNPKQGEEKDTEFYRLLIFGPLGENVSESDLNQSSRVIVVGTPDLEMWTGEDGVEKIRKKIFVTAIGPDLRYAKVDTLTRIHRSNPKPAVEIKDF